MSTIQVRDCKSAAEVFANARAVDAKRRAQFARPALPEPVVEVKPTIEFEAIPEPRFVLANPVLVELVDPAPVVVVELQPVTLRSILWEVAEKHGLSVNHLRCIGRQAGLIPGRQEFCYRAMMETMATMKMIGLTLGGRDHTTILAAAQRYCDKRSLPYPRGGQWKPRGRG